MSAFPSLEDHFATLASRLADMKTDEGDNALDDLVGLVYAMRLGEQLNTDKAIQLIKDIRKEENTTTGC